MVLNQRTMYPEERGGERQNVLWKHLQRGEKHGGEVVRRVERERLKARVKLKVEEGPGAKER